MAMTAKEQELFEKATRALQKQQEQLENLTAPVYQLGIAVAVYDKSIVIDMGGPLLEADRPSGTDQSWVGSGVLVHPKTGQIVKQSTFARYGTTATVAQIDGDLITLSAAQGTITTKYSRVPVESLRPGDHVILNYTNIVIMEKIEIKSKYAFTSQSPLTWDDIGGCVEAKAELRKALELPYLNSKVFEFFKKKPIRGALLWGRPGNGKTLIGRACAGAIARVHGKDSVSTGFIYIKGPEILSKWVGDTEEAIRNAFDHARLHKAKHGYPAVIFIDEADAILVRRGIRTAAGMEQTIVPQFNSEMDGMEDSGAFVLLATNRADILDPAITRPGRCDRRFYIGPPTKESAPEVIRIHMRGVPVGKGVDVEQLIATANETFFSDQYPLYKFETTKGPKIFTLGNLASGAVLAGMVERAQSVAIDRNEGSDSPDGLVPADFVAAVDAMHREQFGFNHYDELKEFVETQKLEEVTGLSPCRTVAEATTPAAVQQQQPKVIAVTAVPMGGKKGGGNYDA